MTNRPREFVADELWLLVAVVTLPLSALAAFAGMGGVMLTTAVLGWFLFTPVLLFWGDGIAALLFDDGESGADDPLDDLKRQYVDGEIDDDEFERRLDRLVAADDVAIDAADDDVAIDAADGDGVTPGGSDDGRAARDEASRESSTREE